MSHLVRMPPLEPAAMNDAQRGAAAALAAGPRGGVKGPFIALLRSPELMQRLGDVGEYLRFRSALEKRISEFLMLIISRHWTQQFEWAVHVPLARDAGIQADTVASLAAGRRPAAMAPDEAIAYDFSVELLTTKGVSDATYSAAGKIGVRLFDNVGTGDDFGGGTVSAVVVGDEDPLFVLPVMV